MKRKLRKWRKSGLKVEMKKPLTKLKNFVQRRLFFFFAEFGKVSDLKETEEMRLGNTEIDTG